MPWNTVDLMDEKLKFIHLLKSGLFTITELCHDFGISRKTGHKYINRYEELGADGLRELSRRAHHNAQLTDQAVVKHILKDRRKHPTWGPEKLQDLLIKIHGIDSPPVCSTIGDILKRNGLIKSKRRKPGLYPVQPCELTQAEYPNHVWTMDFKGWFVLGDGTRCDPLTTKDLCSHYMIGCRAMSNQQYKPTLDGFKCMARVHGLPCVIRVDNGTPWASVGLGRLSRLSVWWIEHGIAVEFTRPGHPQDNGSHERMHKDLKAEATKPPSVNMRAQQRRFDRWVHTYNYLRPHKSLEMLRPAEVYHPSKKRLSEKVKIRYPKNYLLKTISSSGFLSFEGKSYATGEHMANCKVGLVEAEDGKIQVHFANVQLGNLAYDAEGGRLRPTAYIAPPLRKSLDKSNPKRKN